MGKRKRKKVGRPKKEVLPAQMKKAEEYALAGCQEGTICTLMGWEHNFIEDRPDIRKKLTKKRAERKLNIRLAQNKHLPNNPIMSIFLGKNELGQADKQETKLSGAVALLAPEIHIQNGEKNSTTQS